MKITGHFNAVSRPNAVTTVPCTTSLASNGKAVIRMTIEGNEVRVRIPLTELLRLATEVATHRESATAT